jgi:hypothetical protein
MRQVCNRAARLVGGRVIDTGPPFLSLLSQHAGGTAAAYDALQALNREFVTYLGLASNVEAARAHVQRHAAITGVVTAGENNDAAAGRWAAQAQKDLNWMRLPRSNFGRTPPLPPRDPMRGFLSLNRDFVIALRDGGGLAWGAIDFGKESGDIMHFDARHDDVGRVVLAGIRATRT